MLLSILIPVYNEVNTAKSLIDKVLSIRFDADVELIIVNDASDDGTERILNTISDERIKIINHPVNRGKGAAIRTAIKNARGDYLIIQDADLEYNPEDINLLLKKAYEGYDVIYGSRFFNGKPPNENIIHYLGNKLLTKISNLFSGLKLTDMETCYKMIRRSLFEKISIEEDRFGIEPEITAKIAKANLKLCEVPISYRARGFSEGKKIGIKDAFRTIYCVIKYNLF